MKAKNRLSRFLNKLTTGNFHSSFSLSFAYIISYLHESLSQREVEERWRWNLYQHEIVLKFTRISILILSRMQKLLENLFW